MKKKFGGKLDRWSKVPVPSKYIPEDIGPNLGFLYRGFLEEDPTGRFGRGWIRTSLVVSKDGNRIETLNTIYELGDKL